MPEPLLNVVVTPSAAVRLLNSQPPPLEVDVLAPPKREHLRDPRSRLPEQLEVLVDRLWLLALLERLLASSPVVEGVAANQTSPTSVARRSTSSLSDFSSADVLALSQASPMITSSARSGPFTSLCTTPIAMAICYDRI